MSAALAFVTAPASERALTAGDYLIGAIETGALVVALAFGAYRVRRLLLPGWLGAPARLAEIVLGVTALLWISEILGTFGWFEELAVLAATIVVGIGAGLASARLEAARAPEPLEAPPRPAAWNVAAIVAVLSVAALTAAWVVPTLSTLASGFDRTDTLWYHLPLAAKFAQTGYLGHIYYFDPIFLASFYPANSEVIHAVPMLFFDRDIVSTVLNLGWLAMALLSAYCIGRPYGAGPQALIGSSIVLGSQSLVEFQAGEALNDITGVAFVLAAVALLVNGYATGGGAEGSVTGRRIAPPALAVAGIAAGFAAGVKLSFLAPVAALTVGIIVIAPRTTRLRTTLVFAIPMLAAGGYWYLRNLIAVGNPIPYIGSIGPISLPAPVRDFQLRPDYAVVHYWNDTSVWTNWFAPGLHESFGTLWPATLVGMLGVAVYAIWRGGEPSLRALGAFVLVTTVAYVFTPLTAAGKLGEPIAFTWNVRYLAPAIAVGLAILPCLPAARATVRRRAVVLAAMSVVLAFTVGSLVQWHQGHVKGAVAAGVLVVLGAAAIAIAHRRGWIASPRAWMRLAVAVGATGVVIAGGYVAERHYLKNRFENAGQSQDLTGALRWANDIRDGRIAIAGIRGVFTQYPFYGTDLSNEVQWLGQRGPHDAYNRIPDCRRWREAINAGHYTHVVTTFDPYLPGKMRNSPEGRWTESDPNARVVVKEGPVRVFEITGPLDPAGCAGQSPLSQAQLHRVPGLNSTLKTNN
ncbi:MAG: hypothetical protein ACM3H9_11355 [Rhodospirillaceae bacterium]